MKHHRFTKFVLVGCLGAALQLFALTLLTKHMTSLLATPLSVELAILHNFLWHERYTWPDRASQRTLGRLLRFHLANGLVSLCGNTLIVYCLVTQFRIPTLPAAVTAIGLCSFINFAVIDKWVYISRKKAAL